MVDQSLISTVTTDQSSQITVTLQQLPVHYTIQFKSLLMTVKSLHGTAALYISEHLICPPDPLLIREPITVPGSRTRILEPRTALKERGAVPAAVF